jgi:hypothetical protein
MITGFPPQAFESSKALPDPAAPTSVVAFPVRDPNRVAILTTQAI